MLTFGLESSLGKGQAGLEIYAGLETGKKHPSPYYLSYQKAIYMKVFQVKSDVYVPRSLQE